MILCPITKHENTRVYLEDTVVQYFLEGHQTLEIKADTGLATNQLKL